MRFHGPTAVDVIDDSTSELFGWVVREGVTNVVRHAHARTCWVSITSAGVAIEDDGKGVGGQRVFNGNGINGLRERAAEQEYVVSMDKSTHGGAKLTVHRDA